MDRTPPVTTSNIPSGWNRISSFIVQLTAVDYADTIHDTPSGIDKTYYTTDGTEPTTSSPSGPNLAGDKTQFIISGQGNFVIKYFSVDNNGNTERTKTDYVKLDTIAPVTSISVVPPDGTNGWYKTNPIISLVASDVTSGVYKTFYRWNTNTFQEYTATFQIPSQGVHTLQYYSEDIAGNVEEVKTTYFNFDNISPLTQDDAPTTRQKHPVTVNFFTSDNASGVENTYYTTDGSTPTTSSTSGSSVTLSETGLYILKYFSVDFAGNHETVKQSQVDVFVDTEAPRTYISESFPINGTNGWYKTSPLISLFATDPSGIKEIQYRLFPPDQSTTAKYTSTVDISATVDLSANYFIRLEVDQSGTSLEISMRGAVPSQTTIVEIINAINVAIGEDIATETGPSGSTGYGYITLTSPTAGSGSSTSEIKFLQPLSNDATAEVFGLSETSYPHTFTETVVFAQYTAPVTIPHDGHWKIDYYAVDNDDNKGETATKLYKLDSVAPVTEVINSFDPDGTNNWYLTNPEITFNPTDSLSGIYKTFFQWDNGIIVEFSPGITTHIPGEGIHVLHVYSIDLAGNIEAQQHLTYKLDQSPPLTTDDTLFYQGIIFTARGSGYQLVAEENSEIIAAYVIQTENPNVASVSYIYNITKTQEYTQSGFISGPEKNQITVKPFARNENSTRLGNYEIQLLSPIPGTGTLLDSFSDILRIYDTVNGVYYSIDYHTSTLNGHLFLKGDRPISSGDLLQVDYLFNGVPLSSNDVLEVSYTYDISHDPQVLNTHNYTLVETVNQPYVLDHDVTINLYPTDSISSVVDTYYTTDGSEPTTSSPHGTVIQLTETGTYVIKYFSIDAAGNVEAVKTAQYSIVIDKQIPELILTILPDPLEDGENGWFKKNFRLQVDTWTSDKINRYNEDAHESTTHRIKLGVNDTIDFEETLGTELSVVIPANTYTSANLALQIQTLLNSVGDSNYTVSVIDQQTSECQFFKIVSNLSGGTGLFNILWNSGTHSNSTIAKTIGFNSSIDSTGSNTYTSQYFKLRLDNYFIKSVESIRTSISSHDISLVEIVEGPLGFFNEILVDGPAPTPSVVTEQLIVQGTYPDTYSYVSNLPIISGSLIITHDGNPLVENSDYIFNYETGKITYYVYGGVFVATYSLKDKVLVDYTHYIGIDKVNFGIDTTTLSISSQVYNDPDKFLGLFLDRANFRIIFPATTGQFFLQEGQHRIWSKSFDHNSVSGSGTPQKLSVLRYADFKLDRFVPITTDDTEDLSWQKAPVTVTLSAFDQPSGSGISKTHYTTDGTNPTRLSPSSTSIVFSTSGTFILKYFSVDVAGNVESVKTANWPLYIDANAPQTTIFTSPAIPDGHNHWFLTQPTIGFNVVDYQSGVNKTYYKIGDEEFFTEYTSPFLLTDQGEIRITFYSIDNVGNIENENVVTIKYDSVAPVTTTNVPTGYTSNPIVDFIVFDESSGGETTYFTIDGSDPDFSSPHGNYIEFHTSGTFLLKFFSIDYAGNRETTKSLVVYFDLEAPEVFDFQPPDCLITDTTTEISFSVKDNLSGVDINEIYVDVDGVIYSTTKNSSYFIYTGTPSQYNITIYPIDGLLNFQDIEVLRIRNAKDFAGNIAPILEFNFTHVDTSGPWVRQVYPAPNVQDVSTNSNVIAYIDDDQSGIDIKTVEISINGIAFKINSRNILKIQYTGSSSSAKLQIYNKTLSTFIDGQRDVYISLYDANYNTVKKVEQYFNGLPHYSATILDSRFEQKESILFLSIPDLDILIENVIDLFIPDENLNFSFIERGNGYLVFANPNFSFQHKVPVNVVISASDNYGNLMSPFSYTFIPHIYATPSVKKRNYLNTVALDYIEDIQNNIASNYSRSRSTNFYGHQKAISLELARHLEEIDHLNEDRDYETLRAQHLYNKLGYLLLTKPYSGLSHEDYRRMLQSLISIFFKGSIKSSLEAGVELFTGSDVNIIEIVFSEGSDISDQFVFTADILISDNTFIGLDLLALSDNLTHIFNLVKPAHVFIIQRFVWTDQFSFQAGCILQWLQDQFGNYVLDQFGNKIPIIAADGFQAAITQSETAICDRYKYSLYNKLFEDVREDCRSKLATLEVFEENVSVQFTGTEDFFYTYRWPLLKDQDNVADINDVSVTVNGVHVSVLEINPLNGYIKLSITPEFGDIVVVIYKYNQYFVYREVTFYLNDYAISGNSFVTTSGSIFNHENIYQVFGGIQIPTDDLRLHAHICETFVKFFLENIYGDTYKIPECNNRRFFYLNDYTLSVIEFEQEHGSYLNNNEIGNRSSQCPLLFFDINDKKEEYVETPKEQIPSLVIDGRNSLTHDYVHSHYFNLWGSETPSILNETQQFRQFDLGKDTKEKQYSNNLYTLNSSSDFDFHIGTNYDDSIPQLDEFQEITFEQQHLEILENVKESNVDLTITYSEKSYDGFLLIGDEVPLGILNDPTCLLSTPKDIQDQIREIKIDFNKNNNSLILNDVNTILNDPSSLLISSPDEYIGAHDYVEINLSNQQNEKVEEPTEKENIDIVQLESESIRERHYFNLYGGDDPGILNDVNDWLPNSHIKDEFFAFMKVPWFIVAPEPSVPTIQGILNEPLILLNSSAIVDINWAGSGFVDFCKFNEGIFGQKTFSQG